MGACHNQIHSEKHKHFCICDQCILRSKQEKKLNMNFNSPIVGHVMLCYVQYILSNKGHILQTFVVLSQIFRARNFGAAVFQLVKWTQSDRRVHNIRDTFHTLCQNCILLFIFNETIPHIVHEQQSQSQNGRISQALGFQHVETLRTVFDH